MENLYVLVCLFSCYQNIGFADVRLGVAIPSGHIIIGKFYCDLKVDLYCILVMCPTVHFGGALPDVHDD